MCIAFNNLRIKWLAPVPIHSCVANRGQWEQGCSLSMATDVGPVRATRKKKKKKKTIVKQDKLQILFQHMAIKCSKFVKVAI